MLSKTTDILQKRAEKKRDILPLPRRHIANAADKTNLLAAQSGCHAHSQKGAEKV